LTDQIHRLGETESKEFAAWRLSMKTTTPTAVFNPANRPAHLASHYLNVPEMPWENSPFPGIQFKTLYANTESGMSTLLVKMEPGAVIPLHEHTAIEQTYVLEGSLEDDEGQCYAGGFVWRPGGNIHEAVSPHGALVLSIFMKPNTFLSGAKFFTEL
jgi:anti-sigma factor ChrR (cupin superfamily)